MWIQTRRSNDILTHSTWVSILITLGRWLHKVKVSIIAKGCCWLTKRTRALIRTRWRLIMTHLVTRNTRSSISKTLLTISWASVQPNWTREVKQSWVRQAKRRVRVSYQGKVLWLLCIVVTPTTTIKANKDNMLIREDCHSHMWDKMLSDRQTPVRIMNCQKRTILQVAYPRAKDPSNLIKKATIMTYMISTATWYTPLISLAISLRVSMEAIPFLHHIKTSFMCKTFTRLNQLKLFVKWTNPSILPLWVRHLAWSIQRIPPHLQGLLRDSLLHIIKTIMRKVITSFPLTQSQITCKSSKACKVPLLVTTFMASNSLRSWIEEAMLWTRRSKVKVSDWEEKGKAKMLQLWDSKAL